MTGRTPWATSNSPTCFEDKFVQVIVAGVGALSWRGKTPSAVMITCWPLSKSPLVGRSGEYSSRGTITVLPLMTTLVASIGRSVCCPALPDGNDVMELELELLVPDEQDAKLILPARRNRARQCCRFMVITSTMVTKDRGIGTSRVLAPR